MTAGALKNIRQRMQSKKHRIVSKYNPKIEIEAKTIPIKYICMTAHFPCLAQVLQLKVLEVN